MASPNCCSTLSLVWFVQQCVQRSVYVKGVQLGEPCMMYYVQMSEYQQYAESSRALIIWLRHKMTIIIHSTSSFFPSPVCGQISCRSTTRRSFIRLTRRSIKLYSRTSSVVFNYIFNHVINVDSKQNRR